MKYAYSKKETVAANTDSLNVWLHETFPKQNFTLSFVEMFAKEVYEYQAWAYQLGKKEAGRK